MKQTKNKLNFFKCTFPAKSVNEGFSRILSSGFLSQLDPTVEEICDIKTAVSEAVTNCTVHAYKDEKNDSKKIIYISCAYFSDGLFEIKIKDKGCGIEDIEKAMQPLFSGGGEERAGMGFSIMQAFCDKVYVKSAIGKGTSVTMKKLIGKKS